jgi:hypothetical protein
MADPPKRKYKGGAQKQREKKEREAAYRDSVSKPGSRLAVYEKLGPPPEDPVGRMEWGNHLLAILAWEAIKDDLIVDEQARRRTVGDLVFKIGSTVGKALYEKRLKEVERRLGIVGAEDDHGAEERSPTEPPALRDRGSNR